MIGHQDNRARWELAELAPRIEVEQMCPTQQIVQQAEGAAHDALECSRAASDVLGVADGKQ
jgi:hypothetical protein